MKSIRHICFITSKYPNAIDGNALVFLEQLVNSIAKQGIKCTVICPVPININPKYRKLPKKVICRSVAIYYPRYIGFGQKNMLFFNTAHITTPLFCKIADKTFRKISSEVTVDAVYGHFITPSGIAASRIGEKYKIPSFLAYGESTPWTIKHLGEKKVKKELKSLTGVIAVSNHNKNIIKKYVDNSIIGVFPNAVDKKLFKPRDKKKSRAKFGFNMEDFIVSFVGSFDERKGINRLEKAIDNIDGDIKLAAAGKGELFPKTEKCIWNKPVSHDDLPYFYSASDIFVLPTRNEGCCNAIIEAMSCGIPIISSNKPFNLDLLDNKNAILINPDNIEEIKKAITSLRNNEKIRNIMANESIKKTDTMSIDERAKKIIGYMESRINNV